MNKIFLILIIFSSFTACIDPDRGYINVVREYCNGDSSDKTFDCWTEKDKCWSDNGYSCNRNLKGFWVSTQREECRINRKKKTLDCKIVDAVCYSYDGSHCGRKINCEYANTREALETCGYKETGKENDRQKE